MNITEIGKHLEHQGWSDDAIDEYLSHFGVKGMKWGVRREARQKNRALNKASRAKDNADWAKSVEKARAQVQKGELDRKEYAAVEKYKKDKINLGSRKAKQLLAETRQENWDTYNLSQQAKNGKEAAIQIASAVGLVMLYGAMSKTATG
jgi:hypothetical protein